MDGLKKQALIADDEDFIRKLISRILRKEGFEVMEARNGQEAIDIFDRNAESVNLVVLDIRMPERTGWEVFQHLYESDPEIRVILCSGYGDDDISNNTGCFYIQKPFSVDTFRKTISSIMDLPGKTISENNRSALEYHKIRGNMMKEEIKNEKGS